MCIQLMHMNFFKKFKSAWGLVESLDNSFEGSRNLLRDMDFMAYSGSACSPAFCIKLNDFSTYDEAYRRCAPLSDVIDRNARALANANWWLTDNETDTDSLDKFPALKELLDKPNPLQSWSEFMSQLDVYRSLYGEVFVWAVVPIGATTLEATALWVIKPDYIRIELTNKLYFQSEVEDIVKNYYLNVGGKQTLLEKEHVLHIKDTYQNLNFNPTNIRGVSRIVSLENPIKNIIQAYEAIYSLNRDRGAQGILSNDTKDKIGALPVTPNEKEAIQNTYTENYGLLKNQLKVIITDASLKWQQMSYSVKDLMLFEGIQENITQITNTFGYPYELLGHKDGVTFANKLEAKKWHYQDTIIPTAKMYSEKFTSFFGLEGYKLYADFSDVEALKEAALSKADALYRSNQALEIAYRNGIISLEEWRQSIDLDQQIEGNTMYNGSSSEENG